MITQFTSNEIEFRLNAAVAYRYGHNQQMFSFLAVTKAVIELEELHTREELLYLCQSDNIDELHEAVSAVIS